MIERIVMAVACVGGFSEEAIGSLLHKISRIARASLEANKSSIIAWCGPDAVTDTLNQIGCSWIRYRDDGARCIPGTETELSSWKDKFPLAECPLDALSTAVMNATKPGAQVSGLVVFVGDEATADEATESLRVVNRCYAAGVPARSERIHRHNTILQTCWIDTETTGRAPNLSQMIECGVVVTSSDSIEVLGQLDLRAHIEPWAVIEPEAIQKNKYSYERWSRDAHSHDGVIKFVRAWLPARFVLAAYNHSFDRSVLTHALLRATGLGPSEFGWVETTLDPLPIVRRILKQPGKIESAKLTDAAGYFGIPSDAAHTALFDAHVARLVYLALIGRYSESMAKDVGLA